MLLDRSAGRKYAGDVIIRFNSVTEFKNELLKDPPIILRLTKSFTAGTVPQIAVRVIATYRQPGRDDTIVKLERYCGQTMGMMTEPEKKVIQGADKILGELTAFAEKFGVEIRAGVYEE